MKTIVLLIAVLSLIPGAYAAGKKTGTHAKSATSAAADSAPSYHSTGTKRYYAAGCGLGTMLWKENSLLHQVLAVTTNGTGFNTFAMSTGTEDCEVGGQSKAAKTNYIEANKVALANDIARGNGQTLAGLTSMYGCKDYSRTAMSLQQNYGRIFTADQLSGEQINHNINNVLDETQACL